MAIRWDKLTVKSQQAMEQAQARATELGNPEIQPVHLLLALVEDREGVIPAVLEKIGVPTERLESELHQIEEKLPTFFTETEDRHYFWVSTALFTRQPHSVTF